MTTFSKSGFRSVNYNSFRPHYPPSFYSILDGYVKPNHIGKTIDLGCGTGVATYPLLNLSEQVVGLDLSPKMIETANELKPKRLNEMGISDASRIKFGVSAVEDFNAPPELYDLITAAQCIHWFKDYDTFFDGAAKLLKPGGTLAYWYYCDPVFADFSGPSDTTRSKLEITKAALELYHKFVYEDPKWLGPHWEQPGRSILKNYLVEVDKHIPSSFKDVKINKYNPGERPLTDDDLLLSQKAVPFGQFTNYLSTYSSFHNYAEATGDKDGFLESFVRTFEKELGWDREKTLVDIEWFTGYTFARKA